MYFFLYRKGDVTVLVNSLVGVGRAQHASVLYLINGILLLTLQQDMFKIKEDFVVIEMGPVTSFQ